MSRVLITGCSSGVGKAAALLFAEKGYKVAATMRNLAAATDLEGNENIKLYKLDVSKTDNINSVVKQAVEDLGGLDIVVNNAGYALAGVLEAVTDEQVQDQFATNVYGPIFMMRAVLPYFREQKNGCFVNVTSIGGLVALPMNTIYHGTKYGLEGITESLHYEVRDFNVRVKLIEPGGIKTPFADNAKRAITPELMPVYGGFVQKVIAGFTKKDPDAPDLSSTPEQVAEAVLTAAEDKSERIRYMVGEDAKGMWAAKGKGQATYFETIRARFGL